jgi:hypothetical protein
MVFIRVKVQYPVALQEKEVTVLSIVRELSRDRTVDSREFGVV